MATNGFFGKVKAAFAGKSETARKAKEVERKANRKVSMLDASKTTSSPFGWSRGSTPCKKGAFGGTGTGRNLRGKPGVKLLKRTVKAGFKAQKRVVFGSKGAGK